MKEAQDEAKRTADALTRSSNDASVAMGRISTAANDADKGVRILSGSFGGMNISATLAATAVTLAGSALAFFAARAVAGTLAAKEQADAFQFLSDKTGESVESLQRWDIVAKAANTNVETVANTINRLQVSLFRASSESGQGSRYGNVLRKIGIDPRELRDGEDALMRIADVMKSLDPRDRPILAQALRIPPDLIVMLSQGSAEIIRQRDALNDYRIITADAAKAADDLGDSWLRIKASMSNTGVSIWNAIGPWIARVAQEFENATRAARGFFSGLALWVKTGGGVDAQKRLNETEARIAVINSELAGDAPTMVGSDTEGGAFIGGRGRAGRGAAAVNPTRRAALETELASLQSERDLYARLVKIRSEMEAAGKESKPGTVRLPNLESEQKKGREAAAKDDEWRNELNRYRLRSEAGYYDDLTGGSMSQISSTQRYLDQRFAGEEREKQRADAEAMRETLARLRTDPAFRLFDEEGAGPSRESVRELQSFNDALERSAERYRDLGDPLKKYRDDLKEIAELQRIYESTGGAMGLAPGDADRATKRLIEQMDEVQEQQKMIEVYGVRGAQAVDRSLGTVSSRFEELINRGGKFRDFLRALGQDAAQMFTRLFATIPMQAAMQSAATSAGSWLKGAFSGLAGSFAGSITGFASGGEFGAGQRIRVGEVGPEEIAFNQGGRVFPTGSSSGKPVTVNVHNYFALGVQSTVRAEIASYEPRMQSLAIAAVQEAMRRRVM